MAPQGTPELSIDCNAIVQNYLKCRRQAGGACGAVIKADMYGIQAWGVLKRLQAVGCEDFFVATPDELPASRHLGSSGARLYILNAYTGLAGQQHQLPDVHAVINTMAQAREFIEASTKISAVQVDLGMSRYGISPNQLMNLAPEHFADQLLVLGHFSESEVPDSPVTALQTQRFRDAVAALRRRLPSTVQLRTSLANSAGLFAANTQSDLARPGYALFGGNPTPWTTNPMASVVTLTAPIAQVRRVKAGTGVGYNSTWSAPTDGWIACINVGYADGWHRASSGHAMVGINAALYPIVGRVSMDSAVVWTGSGTEPGLNAPVTLIDGTQAGLDIDSVASRAGTIGYEVLTNLSKRYKRRYV